MERIIDEAIAQGVVDGALVKAEKNEHPWPVIIITAVMTILASQPITGMLLVLFGDEIGKSGAIILGLIVVACAVGILRITPLPLFLEYLGVSLIGSGLFVMMIDNHRFGPIAFAGLLTLALTVIVAPAWIRALLAAVSVQLLLYALTLNSLEWYADRFLVWSGCHVAVLGWLGANLLMRRAANAGQFARAAWLESILLGSAIALLGYLAYLSGSTFLVSGLLNDGSIGQAERISLEALQPWVSVVSALAASAWLVSRPEAITYRRWILAAAPVAIIVSWFAVSLGATLLLGTACFVSRRTRLATLAGVAALWTVGALYYAIDWPLLHKSLLMAGAGAVLLASTLLIKVIESEAPSVEAINEPAAPRWTRWGLIVPAVLVMVIINHGIWQKEQVLQQGATVFVELAPVDPRSLMQGDYMTLAFALPPVTDGDVPEAGFVVATRGENGVAELIRFYDGNGELGPDELLIEVKRQGTDYVLVTDAWFFKEGEGARWSGAKFGEFRVNRDGKAVLVSLRGPNLEQL
jgi:uncharacterized membrane-anchored protein